MPLRKTKKLRVVVEMDIFTDYIRDGRMIENFLCTYLKILIEANVATLGKDIGHEISDVAVKQFGHVIGHEVKKRVQENYEKAKRDLRIAEQNLVLLEEEES